MNTLKLSAVASTLTLAVLGAFLTPAAHAQSSGATQRIDITSPSLSHGWVREGDTLVPYAPFSGLRTRAEVVAELKAWQAAGEMVFSGDEWTRRDSFVSTRSRAEVLAEAAASRARGDFVRVGDELLPRHLAERVGGMARSHAPTAQHTAGVMVGTAR